ncbi:MULTISPECIES: ribosome small subunit-dependent GTPase A [Brevibacterium]|jgi:ribosome biogenesis GTPase|uniref:Small ribosomal subunit biogenesis GTPase RsgA n=1 Tax=Brevibacterium salitolerans TaxID=1403566 RepID=A0ABP5HZS8_9MICO|nr:ribosome small subunit-dependent GTPase A [Brevibacterium sp.]
MARIIRSAEEYRPRPSKRGSRPRTKRRPDHADAVPGVVVSVDRGRLRVVLGPSFAQADPEAVIVSCVRAAQVRRRSIVPGDRVRVVGDVSGDEGTLARIVGREERRTVLRRSADDTDPTERVVVANADTLVLVTAAADPEPSWGFLDRALVAAIDAGIRPVIAVTKTDLASAGAVREHFADVGAQVVECGYGEAGRPRVTALLPELAGREAVLLGQSGVGKSTLINELVPGADRATGEVNAVTGSGRHTSSSAWALPLPGGGWVIDTPGIRSFGLAHVVPDSVVAAFEELAPATADCPRGCTHAAGAPGCALDAWVESGRAGPAGARRLASLRRLLGSLG